MGNKKQNRRNPLNKKGARFQLAWLLPITALGWPFLLLLSGFVQEEPIQDNTTMVHSPQKIPLPWQQRHLRTSRKPRLPITAIFFHIYVPMDDDQNKAENNPSQQRALTIIRQQLLQVGKALSTLPDMDPIHLYYTTVGKRLSEGYVEEICREFDTYLRCHPLQHLEVGFEESTLTALHDYCVNHEEHRVIYMHTKGSYHSSKGQDNWRQHMTEAITSRDCMERAHLEGCDLCGLAFLPRPSLHFTGNMYNAKCSYIRKLTKPTEFQNQMSSVIAKGRALLEKGLLVSKMLDEEAPCIVGSDRFAMEHWHGSHPSLEKVCDLSTHHRSEYWENISTQERKPDDWLFAIFPRHPITAEWSNGNSPALITRILTNDSYRLREYFLLPGLLTRWYHFYGEFPSTSSWVWSWYPDGQFWRKQVEEHGYKALELVTSKWREPQDEDS